MFRNLGEYMKPTHSGHSVVSFLAMLALIFSSAAFSKDSVTPAGNTADRVELEDGVLLVRAGDGLFIHDFLTGKTSISALNRTFEAVKGSDVVTYRKPNIGSKNSMFLKEGYFNFKDSKGVGELAEALAGPAASFAKASCNAQYRRAESDTNAAINTCLNGGMMMCESAIERAAQSWFAFDMCMEMSEQ